MKEELFAIGEITKPQGNRGEIRILPLTDFPERFLDLGQVYIGSEEDHMEYDVESVRLHKKFVIVKLKSIDDIDRAEYIRGKKVLIPESQRYQLPEGRYYIYDLIGISCFKTTGEYIGVLSDVIQLEANDVFVIESPEGSNHLVPAVKAIIKLIDREARKIVIDWIDGL